MNSRSDYILSRMPELLRRLQCGPLLNQDSLPLCIREDGKGIYVFYENGRPLYAGRSDDLKTRIGDHSGSSHAKDAFVFILTRDEWGLWKKPIWKEDLYKKSEHKRLGKIKNSKGQQTKVKLSKTTMLKDKLIKRDFDLQRERIKKMRVRVVVITNDYEQAMFEIYAAYMLNTPYNDFTNH